MFGSIKRWRKDRAAYHFGEGLGKELMQVVNSYLEIRLPEMMKSIMAVVRERYTTIYDGVGGAPPHLAAIAEWKIFLENVGQFNTKVVEQAHAAMPQVFQALAGFDSTEKMDAYIVKRADEAKDLVIKEAYCELMKVWIEMEKKTPIPDGPHLLMSAAAEVPGLPEWSLRSNCLPFLICARPNP